MIATHSDQALTLLADPSDREHELLGAIPYQPNEAVLHTDARMLPRRRRAWASWNYHLLDEPTGKPTVTYHMNRLQSLRAEREFCVTLNRSEAIDPGKVIRTIPYAHPVFTAEGQAAQARHAEISGQNRTHYCGAYWGWGFHEDGVVSGERVAERARGGGPVSTARSTRARIRHRRFAVRNARVPLPASRWPTSTSTSCPACSAAASSRSRPGLVRFRRRDYLGDPAVPLADAVRALVAERLGARARGPDPPAHPPAHASATASTRSASTTASPRTASALEAIVAEVTNTPWGERHAYVLRRARRSPGGFDKALHVSPFMPMDQRYTWRAPAPGRDAVGPHREQRRTGAARSTPRSALKRRPLTRRSLRRHRAPPRATLRMLALIYGHAVALKLKGVPVQPHPAR